jgi:predicted small lipoprotein YifL
MKKTALVILLLIVAGCGRKGPLMAPEALAPAPIADLRVEQKGEQFQVSWSRPSAESGGRPLRDLARFQLFKREVLPPGEDCEECPTAYRLLMSADLDYLQGVAIVGSRYLFIDTDLAEGKTYRYKVFSLKKDGTTSRTSNRAGRKKVAPPLPPVLKAVSSLSGVVLEWSGGSSPANGLISGYNIYRKESGEKHYLAPLTVAPVKEAVFEDKQLEWGKRYDYLVRTVAVVNGETVESTPSNEVRAALTQPEE